MLRKLPYRAVGLAVVVGVMLLSVNLRTSFDRILATIAILLLLVVGYFEVKLRRANAEYRDAQYRSIKNKVELERKPRRDAS